MLQGAEVGFTAASAVSSIGTAFEGSALEPV